MRSFKDFVFKHNYNNSSIPVKVSFEWRKNTRISIGQKYVYLRLPMLKSRKSVEKQIQWGKDWLESQLDKNPKISQKFQHKEYNSGYELKINGKSFVVHISKKDRRTSSGRIVDDSIWLSVSVYLDAASLSKTIKKLLSRLVAHYFIPELDQRIRDFNKQYFNEEINKVRIKYNKSNWGSCSSSKNINISSRILFAPKDVQDYVFIHELTHLSEMNHSPKFWAKVKSVVPDYKEKEIWLKENGHLCDF